MEEPQLLWATHLHFFREDDGLLVYEVCIEVSGQLLAEVFVKALIKLAVIAVILLLAPVAVGGVAVLAWNSPLGDTMGPDGANGEADIRYVQTLLNDWRGRNGRDLLGVDGQAVSETADALTDFQDSSGLAATASTGPGDDTITALERDHAEAAAQSVVTADMADLGMDGLADVVFRDDPDGFDPEFDDESEADLVTALGNELGQYFQALYDAA